MPKGWGYRTTLYCSFAIALVHCSFFLYSLLFPTRLESRPLIIFVIAALVVWIGLWLQSKIARFFGALFYLFSAGAAFYPVVFSRPTLMSIGSAWVITMGSLSLIAAVMLVLSKRFAEEFANERERRPIFKKYILYAFAGLIALAAAIATLNDILYLASN